jgi:hypothetical protein
MIPVAKTLSADVSYNGDCDISPALGLAFSLGSVFLARSISRFRWSLPCWSRNDVNICR